jgi:HSP20 family molecular chaperone IbpA
VVQAETTHNHEGKDGDVRFCEFSEKKLFRRIDLPQAVDVDKVTASVDRGVLQVTAPKTIGKKLGVAA